MKKMKIYSVVITGLLSLFLVSCGNDDRSGGSTDDTDDNGQVIVPEEDRIAQFFINTNGATIVDEPKIDAQLTVMEAGVETHTGNIAIEIRGSSSQQFPKKSFGFETRDDANEDLDVSLLGFPEEEDWILYAPYSDKSLVRNHLIYEISNDMGRYASRTRLTEVYINDVYQGVYVFMEKLKRDDNRIDINKLKDDENTGEDLTGGYILKIDKAGGANNTFYSDENAITSQVLPLDATSGQEIHFLYDDPDQEDITPEQKEYITDYMNAFEAALAADTFTDPAIGYAAYIDTESFIDFFLLNELSSNVDGYRISTWLTKDKNGKLKMGPIWDFNLAFGNANYCDGAATDIWAYRFNERCSNDIWQVPFWWERLMEDPAFITQLQNRWTTLRASSFSEGFILGNIDSYVSQLETAGAIENNFDTWDVIGTFVWPNDFIGDSYEEEITYLKNWINERLQWLDTQISSL